MTGTRQQARMLKVSSAVPWGNVPMPDMTAFERPGFVEMREHLASLSPERRAELDAEWRK